VVGRDQEFTEYVGTRWPRLVRTAVLLGCPRAEAESVVQEALVRCLTDWSQVRRADDRDAYVHRVLVERLRAAARHRESEEPTGHDPVLDRLHRLPEDQRLAVVLCDYAGLDELQAATAAGLPSARVEACLVPARAALATTVPVPSFRAAG
jgi:DNA-directed RNA polymerase specialized sigma24 family protein